MSQNVSSGAMRWMVWIITFIMVLTISLAWVFYSFREPYNFFHETISMLGGLKTEEGYTNFPSFVIFTLGFLLISVLCLVTGIIYLVNHKDFNYGILKGILIVIISIGTFGTAIMHDLLTLVHGIGAFLFVSGFGLVNFSWQLMRYTRKLSEPPQSRKWDFYFDAIWVWVLLASILVYFVFTALYYFSALLNFTYVAVSQKILLFAIIIATILLDKDDM